MDFRFSGNTEDIEGTLHSRCTVISLLDYVGNGTVGLISKGIVFSFNHFFSGRPCRLGIGPRQQIRWKTANGRARLKDVQLG